jgi:hypothetical protein
MLPPDVQSMHSAERHMPAAKRTLHAATKHALIHSARAHTSQSSVVRVHLQTKFNTMLGSIFGYAMQTVAAAATASPGGKPGRIMGFMPMGPPGPIIMPGRGPIMPAGQERRQ